MNKCVATAQLAVLSQSPTALSEVRSRSQASPSRRATSRQGEEQVSEPLPTEKQCLALLSQALPQSRQELLTHFVSTATNPASISTPVLGSQVSQMN